MEKIHNRGCGNPNKMLICEMISMERNRDRDAQRAAARAERTVVRSLTHARLRLSDFPVFLDQFQAQELGIPRWYFQRYAQENPNLCVQGGAQKTCIYKYPLIEGYPYPS